MEISKILNENSPSTYFQNSTIYKVIKLFKIELLKILIFIILLVGFSFYFQSESQEYYKHPENIKLTK